MGADAGTPGNHHGPNAHECEGELDDITELTRVCTVVAAGRVVRNDW